MVISSTFIISWDETYEVPTFLCTRCGEETIDNSKAICARWKRKNREARLRHKIDLLNSQLFLCSWFIERHMGIASKFNEFVKETPVECCQGEKLIETRYFTVARRDMEGS